MAADAGKKAALTPVRTSAAREIVQLVSIPGRYAEVELGRGTAKAEVDSKNVDGAITTVVDADGSNDLNSLGILAAGHVSKMIDKVGLAIGHESSATELKGTVVASGSISISTGVTSKVASVRNTVKPFVVVRPLNAIVASLALEVRRMTMNESTDYDNPIVPDKDESTTFSNLRLLPSVMYDGGAWQVGLSYTPTIHQEENGIEDKEVGTVALFTRASLHRIFRIGAVYTHLRNVEVDDERYKNSYSLRIGPEVSVTDAVQIDVATEFGSSREKTEKSGDSSNWYFAVHYRFLEKYQAALSYEMTRSDVTEKETKGAEVTDSHTKDSSSLIGLAFGAQF